MIGKWNRKGLEIGPYMSLQHYTSCTWGVQINPALDQLVIELTNIQSFIACSFVSEMYL